MDIWINAKTNLAMDMAIEANLKKKEVPVKELVPPEYHEFLDVFDEEKANRFPESRKWDHKIDMKEGFEPKAFKNYNLTPEEQIELDAFLKENLEKVIFVTWSLPWHHHSSLSRKRMRNLDLAKIIDISLIGRSKTLIPYH